MADAGYADDITIPNEAELWRRVSPRHFVTPCLRSRHMP